MNFVKLGTGVALNLDSVASIIWEGVGPGLVAKVSYLIPSPTGSRGQAQLASEKFTGKAAQSLYKYLSERAGTVESSAGERLATAAMATTPDDAATLGPPDLLADQLRSQKKGWYYVEDSKGRGYFIALINAKGSCSMRTFDAETGRFLGKRYKTNASYQENFLPRLNNPRELSMDQQPNLERDCRHELPQNTLSQLKSQV